MDVNQFKSGFLKKIFVIIKISFVDGSFVCFTCFDMPTENLYADVPGEDS